jgi:antitoxin PrlF
MKNGADADHLSGRELLSPGFCIETIVSVDERGQMVLPKDLREKLGIRPGDKLALASYTTNDRICCVWLLKSESLAGVLGNMLGPMVREISREDTNKE